MSSTKSISQRFVLYESFIQLNYVTICTGHYPRYSQIVLLQVISSIYTCGNMLFLNFNVFFPTHTPELSEFFQLFLLENFFLSQARRETGGL